MDFDELNILKAGDIDYDYIRSLTASEYESVKGKSGSIKAIVDEMLDFFLRVLVTAYISGMHSIDFYDDPVIEMSEMENTIYKNVAGQTFEDRVREYVIADYMTGSGFSSPSARDTLAGPVRSSSDNPGKDVSARLATVAETEFHRVFNTGAYLSAGQAVRLGMKVGKHWNTMDDDKVRATHEYLEGEAVPYDAEFYTFDGDSARFPGDFTNASNNIGCRCWLTYELLS